jgi:3'-phosphoadenosine 5'-phosphosulfate sulfotransferase (PAPS reductase)/FAD synthetase
MFIMVGTLVLGLVTFTVVVLNTLINFQHTKDMIKEIKKY